MQQQISCVTLGVTDIARSRRFYAEGFGWKPIFEQPDVVFYQMNGLMFATWHLKELSGRHAAQADDPRCLLHRAQCGEQGGRAAGARPSGEYGGRIVLAASAPPHGGMRGYVADPDDHTWEIAWNPQWPISPEGYVTWPL